MRYTLARHDTHLLREALGQSKPMKQRTAAQWSVHEGNVSLSLTFAYGCRLADPGSGYSEETLRICLCQTSKQSLPMLRPLLFCMCVICECAANRAC